MSILVLVFWTGLLLPGYAIARRIDPVGVRSGLLGAIALSFVAVATVLALVMIPGYVIGSPLALFTITAAALFAWSLLDLTRQRAWPEIGSLVLTALGLEIALVIVDLVLSARVGSILGADAIVHVAHIRFLLEHGLVNHDPFVTGTHFYPIYHTNILHTLLAGAAQVTGTDPLVTLFTSLAFAKLLIVSGAWYAGWVIFRSSIAGWVTALFVLGSRGPVLFVLYPNQLAPWFLVPMLVAGMIRTASDGADRRRAVEIAAVMLLIGATHSMYAVFVAMTMAPVFLGWACLRWWRGSDDRRAAVGCALAVAVALPFPVVGYAVKRSATATGAAMARAERELDVDATDVDGADESSAPSADARARTEQRARPAIDVSNRFKRFDGGWVMHKFGRGFTGPRGLRVFLVVLAGTMMVFAGRRRELALIVAMMLAIAMWLHVPPLTTALLHASGAEWMVLRLSSLLDVLLCLILPGSFAAFVEMSCRRGRPSNEPPLLTWSLFRWSLGVVSLFAGAELAAHRAPYTWSKYIQRAREPVGSREGRELRPLLRLAEDLAAHVPPNAVVLADPSLGMRAVMAHDCWVITSTSSSLGVPDLRVRTRHAKRMLRNATATEEREDLLTRYGVTHALVDRPAPKWMYEKMAEFWPVEYGWAVVRLRGLDEPVGPVLGAYDLALLDVGRIEEALPFVMARARDKPEHFGTQFRLGRVLAQLERYDEARAAFEAAQRIRPDDPRPSIMIGNAYAAVDDLDAAFAAYRETIEIAERRGNAQAVASAWFNTGNMHYRLCDWPTAMDAYAEAIRANPGHTNAAHWHAEARRRLEQESVSTDAADDVPEGGPATPPNEGNPGGFER